MTREAEVRNYILQALHQGRLKPKDQLPSEYQLADHLSFPRKVVRDAYHMLNRMGYTESHQGVGHFVKGKFDPVELPFSASVSFSQKMKDQGLKNQTINLSFKLITRQLIDHPLADQLQGPVYQIARLRIINDLPAAIHYSYVSGHYFPDIVSEGPKIGSIFDYYYQRGINQIETGKSLMTIEFPTLEEEALLQCPSLVPILVMRMAAYNGESQELLEITRAIYRSDLFQFIV